MKTTRKKLGNRIEIDSETGSSLDSALMATWSAPCSASSEQIMNEVVRKLIPSMLKKIGVFYQIFSAPINQFKLLTSLN